MIGARGTLGCETLPRYVSLLEIKMVLGFDNVCFYLTDSATECTNLYQFSGFVLFFSLFAVLSICFLWF